MRCSACGLVFVGYRFDATQQKALYDDADGYRAFAEAERSTPEVHSRHREWTAQIRQQFHLSHEGSAELKPRLLDIGCGAGEFLAVARERGFEVRGQDISTVAAQLATQWNGIRVEIIELSEVAESAAEVVTLIGLLEHVIDPKDVLQQAHRILVSQGLLFIYTPVWGTYDTIATFVARMSGNRFTRPADRRINQWHLQIFPKSTLLQLLRKLGFETLCCEVVCEYNLPVKEYLNSLGITQASVQSMVAKSVRTLINYNLFFRNNMRILALKR